MLNALYWTLNGYLRLKLLLSGWGELSTYISGNRSSLLKGMRWIQQGGGVHSSPHTWLCGDSQAGIQSVADSEFLTCAFMLWMYGLTLDWKCIVFFCWRLMTSQSGVPSELNGSHDVVKQFLHHAAVVKVRGIKSTPKTQVNVQPSPGLRDTSSKWPENFSCKNNQRSHYSLTF